MFGIRPWAYEVGGPGALLGIQCTALERRESRQRRALLKVCFAGNTTRNIVFFYVPVSEHPSPPPCTIGLDPTYLSLARKEIPAMYGAQF